MNRAEDFLKRAEYCEEQAARAATESLRQEYRAMAFQWRELAASLTNADRLGLGDENLPSDDRPKNK